MKSDHFCFTLISVVTITLTITYKNHYPTNYTTYQQYLFDRINGYKDSFVSEKQWKKIGDIFNSEGLKTPLGKTFKSNNVHSIYKKGMIRQERLSYKPKVTKRMEVEHFRNQDIIIVD